MSGVDKVQLDLAGSIVGGVVGGIVGGAFFLTGAAVVLLFKGISYAATTASRAAGRSQAYGQTHKYLQESSEPINHRLNIMNKETEELNRRVMQEEKYANKNIKALHNEIIQIEKMQNERFEKQFQEYNNTINIWTQLNNSSQLQFNKQINTEKKAIQQEAIYTSEHIKKLRSDIQNDLIENRTKIENEITKQRNKIDSIIKKNNDIVSSTAARIESIEKITDGHHKLALYWIERAKRSLAAIEAAFNNNLKSQTAKIKENLEKLDEDIKIQAYESVILSGRELFQSILNLKEQLIFDEIEKNKLYAIYKNYITKISEDLNDDSELEYDMQTSEGNERVSANINYWTDGKFESTKKLFEENKLLNNDIEKMKAEDIKKSIVELEKINTELAVIRQIGKANFILSHNRYVQGCHFADIFAENFSMTDCEGDYEGEDQRGAYIGIYKNPVTNDAIAVKIQPTADEFGIMNQNSLEIHYFNENNNEEQREQWRQKINGLLGNNKLSCKSRKGLPSDQVQMTNVEWIKKQKQKKVDN